MTAREYYERHGSKSYVVIRCSCGGEVAGCSGWTLMTRRGAELRGERIRWPKPEPEDLIWDMRCRECGERFDALAGEQHHCPSCGSAAVHERTPGG